MEELLLRKSPELKIIIDQDQFEVIDTFAPENNGVYSFKNVQQIQFNQTRTNWFISIFNTLFSLFLDNISLARYKDKTHLLITLKKSTLKILLHDANSNKVKEAVGYIENKIRS